MSHTEGVGELAEFSSPLILHYLSVRVTCPHVDVRRMLEAVFKDAEYICYRHKGGKTGKEHVHVLVPDVSLQRKLKDRLNYAGYKGNETFSIKGMHNGLYAGIRYCSKEGGLPLTNGDFDKIIADAPKWVEKRMDAYVKFDEKPRTERDWELSYTNMVPQAVAYARTYGLTAKTLKEVCQEMFSKTKWKPSNTLRNRGVHYSYDRDYEFRMGRSGDSFDMSWWTPMERS